MHRHNAMSDPNLAFLKMYSPQYPVWTSIRYSKTYLTILSTARLAVLPQ